MGKISVKADEQDKSNSSRTHKTMEKSSTLNRKYVRKPKKSPSANSANSAKVKPATKATKSTAKSVEAAKSAVKSVEKIKDDTPKMKTKRKPHRILLAVACSAVTVIALFFFVQTNMPDITVKVAAMQTGIEATYPSYIPRNYALRTVTSEKNGSITMSFEGPDNASFTLTEEKSTWDSNALLNNYVKGNFSSEYSTLRERGITVYTDSGNATWVNGGILYKVNSVGRRLSKEQIINLVSSL